MLRKLFRRAPTLRQVGALAYRVEQGEALFLLVTSRRTGRWIAPKGGLVGGAGPAASAAQEAQEEAGVSGRVGVRPIGVWRTRKVVRGRTRPLLVDVYPMRVETIADAWPEMDQRQRLWASEAEALELVKDADLRAMISATARALRAGQDPVDQPRVATDSAQ